MEVADPSGLPVSIYIESATPHEVTLVQSTLDEMVISEAPANLVGDNAYDSDKLDTELREYGIEVIAPHRRNRKNETQDGRGLRRYHRRWKIERLFAWLQNFRRLVIRYERYPENFLDRRFCPALVGEDRDRRRAVHRVARHHRQQVLRLAGSLRQSERSTTAGFPAISG